MTQQNQRINILWLVDHLGYNGFMHGAGKYYLNSIPYFDKNKFNVTLCVLREKDHLTKLFEHKGIKTTHLGRGKIDPRTLLDLVKIVKDEKIDLIHCHGYGSANFGRLTKLVTKIPVIIHAHDDDRFYPWYQRLSDLFLRNYADKAIAVSEAVKESGIHKRKIPTDRIFVMHNGIPLEEFNTLSPEEAENVKRNLGITANAPVIGTIAKLRVEKGTEYFVKAAPEVLKEFPDAVFLVIGDGPLRSYLEDLAKKLSIEEKIIFAGFREDIAAILSFINICVIPSLTEGSPLALLEAMAMSKPVVAAFVGGMREILVDGETGLFVPSKDPKALSEKIIYLLKNKCEAERIGMKAGEESKKYDINLYAKNLEKYYIDNTNTQTNRNKEIG
jgi:glycosyltransferase involved in cell wall biosynthesis